MDENGTESAQQHSKSAAGSWASGRQTVDSPQTEMGAVEILNGLTTGVIVVAPDGTIQRLNASAEAMLGISAARGQGQSFYTLFPDFTGLVEL